MVRSIVAAAVSWVVQILPVMILAAVTGATAFALWWLRDKNGDLHITGGF